MSLQKILLAIKDKTKLSDKKIAEIVGTSQPTITRLKNGKPSTSFGNGTSIINYAKQLGIDCD